MKKSTLHLLLVQAGVLCAVTACGGGGGGGDAGGGDTPPVPTAVTLTGKLMANWGVKGATVCLDLNANGQCDAGEPASAATGADGSYSLTTDPAKTTAAQAAAAPFAAMVPATAVDAADTASTVVARPVVLTAPAGKGAQINPLTTLVQTGVASGLSRADAEAAVAVQMGVAAADIYDYQSQPRLRSDPFPDSPRLMALLTLDALENGVPLKVIGLTASDAASNELRALTYTDAQNYYVRTFQNADEAGTGKRLTTDKRTGLTNGAATTDAVLYGTAYLAPGGWVRCDATPFHGTRGTPNRSDFCGGGQRTVGYSASTDVSGKNMGDVIRQIQADTTATHALNLNASLVNNASFPAGSAMVRRKNAELGQSIYVNNLNSANEYLTGAANASLEAYIQSRQNANVNLAQNTGLVWLGFTGDANHWLAGAFIDATSKVQYYSCTVKTTNGVQGYDVCTATGQGSFAIVTQGGKRLIKFAGQPAPVASVTYTVGYGEYASGVMVRFRETRVDDERYLVIDNNRLNEVAGNALLKALGL